MSTALSTPSDALFALRSVLGTLARNQIAPERSTASSCCLADGCCVSLNYLMGNDKFPAAELHMKIFRAFAPISHGAPLFVLSFLSSIPDTMLGWLPVLKDTDISAITDELLRSSFESFSSFLIKECGDKSVSYDRAGAYSVILTDSGFITVVSDSSKGLLESVFRTEEYLRVIALRDKRAEDIVSSVRYELNSIIMKHHAYKSGSHLYFRQEKNEKP